MSIATATPQVVPASDKPTPISSPNYRFFKHPQTIYENKEVLLKNVKSGSITFKDYGIFIYAELYPIFVIARVDGYSWISTGLKMDKIAFSAMQQKFFNKVYFNYLKEVLEHAHNENRATFAAVAEQIIMSLETKYIYVPYSDTLRRNYGFVEAQAGIHTPLFGEPITEEMANDFLHSETGLFTLVEAHISAIDV